MYSNEIEQFLKERNFIVNSDECMQIMNPNESTQIKEIKCFSSNCEYLISTNDGYQFKFWVK